MRTPSRPWLVVLAICVLAFALRVVATVMFEGMHAPPNDTAFYDGVEFEAIATNLVEHGEFSVTPGEPTSFRAPGLPFVLAGLYAVTGTHNYFAAHVLFCLIGSVLPLLVFGLTRKLADDTTAIVAAFLVAVYPNVAYYSIHFASEPLYSVLLVASVWALVRGFERRSLGDFLWSGLLLGGAALARPIAFLFTPFFALTAAWKAGRPAARRLVVAALGVVGVMLVVGPWTARNYAVHDRLAWITSNGGSTLWGSNNDTVLNVPGHRGLWVSTNQFPEEKARVLALTNEVDRDRLESDIALAWIRTHIADLPRLLTYKSYQFWAPSPGTPNRKFNAILMLTYGPLLPLMIAGIWLFGRRHGFDDHRLVATIYPIATTFFFSLVFHGASRFRATIEPFLLIYAAIALMAIWRRFRGESSGSTARA